MRDRQRGVVEYRRGGQQAEDARQRKDEQRQPGIELGRVIAIIGSGET
jgi:hypothetical protein